ncbi:MAG: hypothetical protein HZA17_05980 [Nitrospirae bacterium]|nr:hypothetical protein [Nitrospirota bacterium]
MAMHYEKGNMLGCPFCDRPLSEPSETMSRFGNIITGGKCECGAVYVYDRSGHNMGDAYVDLLTLSCDGDLDKAWGLSPGEDYEVRELTYDSRRNKFGRESKPRGKPMPVFLFLRLKKDAS